VSPGALDAYLRELARALHERGHAAVRIVAEAREHLADAVEDGLRRGLSREDAEREAVERFGPPDLIAAQAPPVRSRTMSRLTASLDTIVGHWRWLTAATAVAAVLAGAVSYYVLPTFYRSESVIVVTRQPPREREMDLRSRAGAQERMQSITTTILSDSRLEPILKDFGLGPAQQVRRNISVVIAPEPSDASGAIGVFKIAFQSTDPRLSQKVTERLTSLFIVENLELREAGVQAPAIGDQFRVSTPPNLPKDPLRPGFAKTTASGAFAGLALSVVALFWRRPSVSA
jgi:capsular polysaccharide biosynthesis protein